MTDLDGIVELKHTIMKTQDSKSLIEALEITGVIITLYTFSPAFGIIAALIAAYCLISKNNDSEDRR